MTTGALELARCLQGCVLPSIHEVHPQALPRQTPRRRRGEECDLEDLPSLDPELHRNLTFLLEHRASGGDVADLSLTFCLEEEVAGTKKTVDLVPGGRDVQVDNSNVLLYIHAVADWKLNKQVRGRMSGHFLPSFLPQLLIQTCWL